MLPFLSRRIYKPLHIEVRQSPIHGNGVFASTSFNKGDIIEKAPVIFLDKEDKECLQNTMLFRYYFVVPVEATPAAIGLGYSSVYNHSYTANAFYEMNVKEQCLIIKAFKRIELSEEITLNYNGQPENNETVYFD